MGRTPLKERELPEYTRGEEIFNMVSHIVGGVFAIAALVLCIIVATIHNNTYGIVSSAIYGTSMIFLYTMSSIYHGLSPKRTAKKVFQIIDHCSIFLLISGTYTPLLLCSIREADPITAWWLFGIVWGLTILGITLNAIDLKKFKIFSMICYLVMGWCIIFKIGILYNAIGFTGFMLILSGGIAYTIGAAMYILAKKKHIKYMHSIFHLAVLIASILHFLAIILYVL